jgi:hypothetical protein
MSAKDITVLQVRLASLLGFDDGASDVLEHLLTIESREDLLEYLSQLLGDDETPSILEFVDNVGFYQQGAPLKYIQPSNEDSKHVPRHTESKPQQPQQTTTAQSIEKNSMQASSRQNNHLQKQTKSRVPPPKKNESKSPPSNTTDASALVKLQKAPPSPATDIAPKETKEEPQSSTNDPVKKSHPPRGKANIICGCFGTVHKALTNCLFCGRISCTKEGYDFCPLCGFLVEQVVDGMYVLGQNAHGSVRLEFVCAHFFFTFSDDSNDNDKAWVQKERLLRFDKEFARRTEIFDDQSDYQAPSGWMTAEEENKAEEKQVAQLQQFQRSKQKQTLSLAI